MPRKHNAKYLVDSKREAIVSALANGEHIIAIARRLHVSNHTVHAVRDQDWQIVAQRKERIAAQAERNATRAAELIAEQLANPKEPIPLSTLNMTFGIAVDKALSLRADPTIQVQHSHAHIHAHINHASFNELLDHLPSSSPQENSPSPLIRDVSTTKPESAA